MELDRLTTQETQIKMIMKNSNLKNDGYTSDKSRQTLSEKETHLESIKASLKRLEDEIERYTKLSKEGKESVTKTQQTLHQKQSDLAVVKERIKTQQQTIDRLNNQSQQTKNQLNDVKEKLHSLIRMK